MTVSLYDRLGGYDAIAMFASRLVDQAKSDDQLGRFWANRGDDRIARELQLLIDYLVRETGGQMYYTGRQMLQAHAGMGISESDWKRFIEIVTGVAGELGVGAPEDGEVMAFLDALKSDIVNV
ncbi:group 1 truncated hemoglobin [Hyphomonas sp.]|uniref:group I truncated hemoglobin n=1 Tax=Hyphomonas sp. TaxID=87 RepID=UPI00352849B2